MEIKWLGHACFLITGEAGLRIVTDPYEANFRGIINYGPVKERADIVTISHQHGDHNYTAALQGAPAIVQGAAKHQVKGLEFTGISSYHDQSSGKERGENTIFCFTVDGVRICHCGDLGHPLDAAALRAIGPVDILLMPTGGPGATLELEEAVAVWEQIQPAVVIPMHFRNEKCKFPKYGADDLMKLRPGAVQTGQTAVTFTAGRLPAGQILILEPAL